MKDIKVYVSQRVDITPELIHKHQMEIIEEAWKLFNWAHNVNIKKQNKLIDYEIDGK